MSENRKLTKRLLNLLNQIDTLRNDQGGEVAADFRKLPIRTGTDYYKFITKPISLHTITRHVKKGDYVNAQEFITDLAQITWNARHYNEPNSPIYENAIILDNFIKEHVLAKLSTDKAVPNGNLLFYPDLGPLDDYSMHSEMPSGIYSGGSPTPAKELDDDHDMSYHNDEFRPYTSRLSARETPSRHAESGVKRGRPPIIDKPYESRIKAILKQFKKLRHPDDENYQLSTPFERLPDKTLDVFYRLIEFPISLNEIRVKVRSRKYADVDQFIYDLNMMLNNAKTYYNYVGDQELLRDTGLFEAEANTIVQQELSKPDSEFIEANADGKTPLDVVEVNGFTYKVGDWVLISNPNDPNKPTAGQIFRLWQTEDGTQYTNVCWYIRPEQTCHRYDRIFYKNEVCKTGEYRDHLATDIVGPCYVIFLTHYQKGDVPDELLPHNAPWFICEFRYNNNNYVFNRIRTWKACLPDEIRDEETPVRPINEARKLVKYDSPLKHLLSPDAKIGGHIPPVQAGPSPHGPPMVGSVYPANPILDDDLGQCSTSPNVVPSPEYDDHESGRRAYIFTPISQMKGGSGGGTSTVPLLTHASPPLLKGLNFDDQSFDLSVQSPSSGAFGQLQIRPSHYTFNPSLQYGKSDPPPAISKRISTPPVVDLYNVHGGVSQYHPAKTNFTLTTSNNGVVSYSLEDETGLVSGISKELQTKGPNEIIWFKSPPVVVSSKIDSNSPVELGHSAKYLAWKASRV